MLVYATLQRIILPKSRSTLTTGRIRETEKVALRSQSCFTALPVSSYGQFVYVTEHCGIYKIYQKFRTTAVGSIFGTASFAYAYLVQKGRAAPLWRIPSSKELRSLRRINSSLLLRTYPSIQLPFEPLHCPKGMGHALPQQTKRISLPVHAVCSPRFLPATPGRKK